MLMDRYTHTHIHAHTNTHTPSTIISPRHWLTELWLQHELFISTAMSGYRHFPFHSLRPLQSYECLNMHSKEKLIKLHSNVIKLKYFSSTQ